jgi:hypothetical protein
VFTNLYSKVYTAIFLKSSPSQELIQSNNDLKNEIQNLKLILQEKNISEEEINSGLVDTIRANKVGFDIFGKDIIYSDIILDKGTADGVNPNAKVYISGMSLVGEIVEAYEKSSKMRLYSSSNLEIELVINSVTIKKKENIKINTEDIINASNTETGDLSTSSTISTSDSKTETESQLTNKYSVTGAGDGTYGINIKIPESVDVKIGEKVYLKDDLLHSVGEVVDVKEITSQKEKVLYVKTNYFYSDGSSFYILK